MVFAIISSIGCVPTLLVLGGGKNVAVEMEQRFHIRFSENDTAVTCPQFLCHSEGSCPHMCRELLMAHISQTMNLSLGMACFRIEQAVSYPRT